MNAERRDLVKLLPHRYPMLLLDAVSIEYGVRCTGYKRFTVNELAFGCSRAGGSFDLPVLVESLSQLASLAFLAPDQSTRQDVLLVGINRLRYRKRVEPGDRVDMDAAVLSIRHGLARVAASATVDGTLVCKGELVLTTANSAYTPR